tara:strand:- start:13221 stop:13628 length:408 start_codon:yes stop_codon:yes gene_type:complete
MKITVPKKLLPFIHRDKKDFVVTFYRAKNPGGQHANKTDTACRIKDKKTGLISECSEHKSQLQNKKTAFRRLVHKIVEHYRSQEIDDERKLNNGWAEKIRTYHEPRGTVKDHRTGVVLPYKEVIDGKGLERFLFD